MSDSPVAVYVHIPFCPSKCGYCDFNSYAMTGDIIDRTTHAIQKEILSTPWKGRPAKTIFFGGGTPTFISSDALSGLLKAVYEVHPPTDDCEITSEANPGTVDADKFASMRKAGFNRLSLGAQSFQTEDLIQLGRVHSNLEIGRAVLAARQAGFRNVNFDLMFALPGQSQMAWEKNLDLAAQLQPDHISLYCLTIEPNTRFNRLNNRGMLHLPDDDTQVRMYESACRWAHQNGLHQYEISNFSAPGKECRHNLAYWHNEEYLGYGPGAVGCFDEAETRTRYTVLKHPERYADCIETGAKEKLWCEQEQLTPESLRTERIMMGLRLNSGLPLSPDLELPHHEVEHLTRQNWVALEDEHLRLTPEGRHFCSEVALRLI